MKKILTALIIPFLLACDNKQEEYDGEEYFGENEVEEITDPREPSIENFIRAINNSIQNRRDLRACVSIRGQSGTELGGGFVIDNSEYDLIMSDFILDDELTKRLEQVNFITDVKKVIHPADRSLVYTLANFTQKAYDEADVYKQNDMLFGNRIFRYTLCTGTPQVDRIIQATNGTRNVKVLANIRAEYANDWIYAVKPEVVERELKFDLELMYDGWVESSQVKVR